MFGPLPPTEACTTLAGAFVEEQRGCCGEDPPGLSGILIPLNFFFVLYLFHNMVFAKFTRKLSSKGLFLNFLSQCLPFMFWTKRKFPFFSSSSGQVRVVGDNLDFRVGVRQMWLDHRATDNHWFNMLVVCDRVPLGHMHATKPVGDLVGISPTQDELKSVRSIWLHWQGASCASAFTFLRPFRGIVDASIPCEHAAEMLQKSTVALGVLDLNEASHSDMAEVIRCVQQQVRDLYKKAGVQPPHAGTDDEAFYTLFGGDQLTVEREIGAQSICASNESRRDRLEEVIPCCENWHVNMVFLVMCYSHLYNTHSQSDIGTLYHLRQMIDWRDVSMDVKHSYHACADFFRCAVEAHIVAAVCEFFGVSPDDDARPQHHAPPSSHTSQERARNYILPMLDQFIDSFISTPMQFPFLSLLHPTTCTSDSTVPSSVREVE